MNNNRPSFFQNTHQGFQQGSGQFTNSFSTNNNILPSISSQFPQHFPQSQPQQFFLPQQHSPQYNPQQFFPQQQGYQQQIYQPQHNPQYNQQQYNQQQFFSQQQGYQQQVYQPQHNPQQFFPQQQGYQQQVYQPQHNPQQFFPQQQGYQQQNIQQLFQFPLQRQTTNQQTLQVLSTPTQQQRVTTLQSQSFDFSKLDLKSSVNEAGLWQMDTSRRQDLGQQLSQFLGTNSPSSDIIRIDSQKNSNETWGNSADENVRTQFLRDNRRNMRKDEAETSFNQRSHQGTLIWKTDSPVLTTYGEEGDDSQLLSGHTPGLKTKQVPGTTGALTKEHGRRDILRQGVVHKTLSDSKRGDHDLAIVSKLATIQLMMSPKEELEQVKSDVQGGGSMFSQFKDIGDISGKQGNFDPFTQRVQYVREKEKMHAAKNLLIRGFDNLVPDNHRKLLSSAGGDVDKAMQTLIDESQSKKPSITFNTAISSQTDRLDQDSLREMSQKTSGRPRALSDPRRVDTKPFNF